MGRSVSSAQAVLTGIFPQKTPGDATDCHVIRLNRGPQWMVYSKGLPVLAIIMIVAVVATLSFRKVSWLRIQYNCSEPVFGITSAPN